MLFDVGMVMKDFNKESRHNSIRMLTYISAGFYQYVINNKKHLLEPGICAAN